MSEIEKKPSNEFNQQIKPASLWADAWKRLRKNRMALVSLFVVLGYIVITMGAPLWTSMGILASNATQNRGHEKLPPSFDTAGVVALKAVERQIANYEAALAEERGDGEASTWDATQGFNFGSTEAESTTPSAGSDFDNPILKNLNKLKEQRDAILLTIDEPYNQKRYLLGTDDLGRDMIARTIYGGRISILIGLIGTITAVLIGVVVGAFSGYLGGAIDNVIMRFVDIMYGLPYMLVVIIIMSIVGQSGSGNFLVLFVAIALVSWLTIARVVRGQIISLKNSEFVEAARSMGASTPRIIFKHLLPNAMGIIIIYATLSMPSFIMSESFLSFLGIGISAPDASWGTLVSEGVKAMSLRAWQLLIPALSMTVFLFSMNFLGDGVRDALDPQSKNRT